MKTNKEVKTKQKKKNEDNTEEEEQITAHEARNKLNKITGFSQIDNSKNEHENTEDYNNITNKFLKIKNKNMLKLMNIKVSDGDLKFLDPKEFIDHIENLNVDKIDFIRIETKFSIKKRNF